MIFNKKISSFIFKTILAVLCSFFFMSPLCSNTVKGDEAEKSVSISSDRDNSFSPETELKRLNKLIEAGGKDPGIFYNRGWIYEYIGSMEKARLEYTRAIEMDNEYADAYYNRGIIHMKQERFEEAVRDFNETIKLAPSIDAYCNRGNSYLLLGKAKSALNDYNEALRIDSDDADLYYNRAVVYLLIGNKTDADRDLKKASDLGHEKARKYLGLEE